MIEFFPLIRYRRKRVLPVEKNKYQAKQGTQDWRDKKQLYVLLQAVIKKRKHEVPPDKSTLCEKRLARMIFYRHVWVIASLWNGTENRTSDFARFLLQSTDKE